MNPLRNLPFLWRCRPALLMHLLSRRAQHGVAAAMVVPPAPALMCQERSPPSVGGISV